MKKAFLIALLLPFAARAQQVKPLTDAQFINQDHYTYVTTGRYIKQVCDTVPVILCVNGCPKRAYRVRLNYVEINTLNMKPIKATYFLCEDRKTPLASPSHSKQTTPGQID